MNPRRPWLPRPLGLARAALAALALAGVCTATSAASPVKWPERPVRLIHGFTAGGNVDIQARIMGSGISEETGQPVVIDMRPGAGGTIAAAIVAKSAPDGQTLFWMAAGHATAPGMYRKLPYDAVRDFTMLSVVSGAPYLVAVGPSSPVSSMEDLVKTARAQPGKLLFASAGVGTGMYLVAVRLQSQTGIQLTHVAYKGGTSTPMAVAQGEVPMMFGTFAEVRPHLDSGRLRVIGVTSPQRWDRMPAVPTFAETVAPGFSASGWQAIAAPGGMAPPLVSRIESVIHRVLKRADVQQRFAEIGSSVALTPATEAQRFLASEVAAWTKVIRDAGIATQDF
ncbi:MAG: tripartite tricarboxylate transporter substrate-binding protein [Pseudomonadota bacterium]|jgi:tripartite-type tricarboxylate transporter receptor subunit TctC